MGTYNSLAPTLATGFTCSDQADTTGSIYSNNEGRKASYRAVASGIAVTANGVTTSTIGTGGTLIAQARPLFAPATALPTYAEFTFGTRNAQSFVLRGAAEYCQISVAAGSYTGALFDCDVEFTEE